MTEFKIPKPVGFESRREKRPTIDASSVPGLKRPRLNRRAELEAFAKGRAEPNTPSHLNIVKQSKKPKIPLVMIVRENRRK